MIPPVPAAADRELLERLQQTADVRTAPPEPSLGEYFGYLVQQLTAWVKGLLTRGAERIGLDDPAIQHLVAKVLLWSAGILAVATLAHLLFRLVQYRRRQPGVFSAPATGPQAPQGALIDGPERWLRRLQRRLAAGEPLGALEALWWWLGTRLAGDRLDPAWTSRELLRHTGQAGLRPDILFLDRLRYGPGSPTLAAVSDLSQRLQRQLGSPAHDGRDKNDDNDGSDAP
jgi:hypothetical protein